MKKEKIFKIWLPFILNGVMLLLAGFALYVSIDSYDQSIDSYNQAKEQFVINSKSTQAMFDSLMDRSEKLNDNIVSQLITLQQITNNQLKITEEQLKTHNKQLHIQRNTLRENIESLRPKVLIDIKESSGGGVWSSFRITSSNTGYRKAMNFKSSIFFIFGDFSGYRSQNTTLIDIEPSTAVIHTPRFSYDSRYSQNYYLYYQSVYYDEKLDTNYNEKKYFKNVKDGLTELNDNDKKLKTNIDNCITLK